MLLCFDTLLFQQLFYLLPDSIICGQNSRPFHMCIQFLCFANWWQQRHDRGYPQVCGCLIFISLPGLDVFLHSCIMTIILSILSIIFILFVFHLLSCVCFSPLQTSFRTLNRFVEEGNKLPPTLYVQLDNTGK